MSRFDSKNDVYSLEIASGTKTFKDTKKEAISHFTSIPLSK